MLQFASNALCQKDLKYFTYSESKIDIMYWVESLTGYDCRAVMIVWGGNYCLGGNTSIYNEIKFSYHMQL